ncbi:hypothetical protein U9M48_029210 [Paspalum notatum var. saurae]|uniref:Uncharacterized protein n=1 Tax=Paspalum notatum var. saurae TaxID=547442 RepID=A0AAQ3U0G3_PASNO
MSAASATAQPLSKPSSSIRESALSFFLDVLLCCSWRRVELLLFRSATAETAESTFIGLQWVPLQGTGLVPFAFWALPLIVYLSNKNKPTCCKACNI